MSTQLASYNFSIVENPLSDGGNFTIASDDGLVGSLQVLSGNLCEPTTLNQIGAAFYSGITWPNDQYSEITLTTIGAGSQHFLLIVRGDPSNSGTYYLLQVTTSGIGAFTLISFVDMAQNSILSGSSAVSVGDVWRLAVQGTTLTVYQNGVSVGSVTDSTITSGTPGFGLRAATAEARIQTSLWAGGNPDTTPVIPSVPTVGSIFPGTYMGSTVQAAFSNPSGLDLMQVANEGGTVVWNLNSTGTATVNPSTATNGTILGRFLGSSFSTAFPNPSQLDVLQIRELGGSIIFHVDYQGNAHTP